MGNTAYMCCKRISNNEIDLIDIINPDLTNNLSDIIKIR